MAKQFNNREKEIIKYIYLHRNDTTFVLTNVFSKWFYRTGVSFDLQTGDISYATQNINDVNVNDILSDENGIVEVALLIKYLEDHGYIYLIQQNTEIPDHLGSNISNLSIINTLPSDIVSIISKTLRRVYVSYDLVFLVEHEFKTYEDLQLIRASENLEASKKQISLSRGSLIMSALTLICTLILSQFSNCSQNKHKEAMLNALANFEKNYCANNHQNTLELSPHIDSLGVSFSKHNAQNVSATRTKHTIVKKQYNLIQIDTINCEGKQYIVLPIKK